MAIDLEAISKTGNTNSKFKVKSTGKIITKTELSNSKALQKKHDVHVVKPKDPNKKSYIRSNPNKKTNDNLG